MLDRAVLVDRIRPAAGDADGGFARFAGTIDHAADHSNIQRLINILETPFQLGHGLDHVEVLARTGWAGDQVDAAMAQVQGFQNVPAYFHFLHRISRQRDADGVADAFGQQYAKSNSRFDRAGACATGLGNAQVQRGVGERGQFAERLDRHEHIGRLEADLVVVEVMPVQDVHVPLGGFHHGVGVGLAVFFLQIALQRAGIDTDAHRHLVVFGAGNHFFDFFLTADVAGIDAQAVCAAFGRGDRAFVVEVNVCDQRHVADLFLDLGKSRGRFQRGHRHAHDIGAGFRAGLDLCDRGGNVLGVGAGHGLHRDGRTTANGHPPHPDLARFTALDGVSTLHGS